MRKINVALIGLGFGGAFVEIYKKHPNINNLVVFDLDKKLEKEFEKRFDVKVSPSFEDILNDSSIDAVHIVTPIPCHAKQIIQVLNSGKHCACTVPMAISLEELDAIIEAKKKSKKHFMLMETTLYTYHFFYVKHMLETGELGKIQFMRGSHYQDMENWPSYWKGLPPMWYGTHAVSPMIALSGSHVTRVVCFGSGTMREELQKQYNNPYPIESALFEFANGLKGEATRSLFETARMYQEGMFIYGSKKSFEWGLADNSNPYITTIGEVPEKRGRPTSFKEIEIPNFYQDLPKELYEFTVGGNYDPLNPQESLQKGAGAGHHGSHPHLVNEFINLIIKNKKPLINVKMGVNITAACICAHQSALAGGKPVKIPKRFQ